MHAVVTIRAPDGTIHDLVTGDVIGRMWSAALLVYDGRVSEAHALISLREGELQLVSLRGGFAVHGRPVTQVALTPGLRISLAQGLDLEVLAVCLPDRVLGVEGDRLPWQALPGVCSVVVEGSPRLVRGWLEEAAAHLWWGDQSWWARTASERAVTAGDTLVVGGHTLRFVELPLRAAGPTPTRRSGEVDAPITVVARFHTVHIQRDDLVLCSLAGMQARLISELAAIAGPIGWAPLSTMLWSDDEPLASRRARMDVLLSRLRARLRAAGVRDDLVRSAGTGQIELFLHPRDTLVDET